MRNERENSWKIREEREKVAGWLHFVNKKVDIGVNSFIYIYIYIYIYIKEECHRDSLSFYIARKVYQS